jgi:hypothetical protein
VRRLLAFALVLAGCTGSDRSSRPTARGAESTAPARGPDALILRLPRAGGAARVSSYPNLDSTVWTASEAAPAPDHVLAFDADAGLISAADTRGLPFWIDLHIGSVTRPGRGKLTQLVSVDGSNIFGVGADGAVARFTPEGNWLLKPPQPAREIFPQSTGLLLILGGHNERERLWLLHPPETRITDSVSLPQVTGGAGAPLGERVFFVRPPRTLVVVRARNLVVSGPIQLDHTIHSIVTTPSGDRAYVITDSSNTLYVIDPYSNRVAARSDLPGRARDLRVDPFGRYLLVRSATGDSVWVVSVGNNRVVETVHSQWRGDLPLVAIDGAIVLTDGRDVIVHSPSADKRVAGGASDFWYPFVWNGFRPRAASLDQPAKLPGDSDSTMKQAPPRDSAIQTPVAKPPVTADSSRVGFTVSFAALLDQSKARDMASTINVNGQVAHVVTGMLSGTAIYHVVLGPYATRDEADRVGRASGQAYVVAAGTP